MDYIKWIRSKVGHEKIILTFVVGIMRNEKGQILLQRRGDSNLWGITGGAMELSEKPEETLRREIFEETGIEKFSIQGFQGVYTTLEQHYPNGDVAQCVDLVYQVDVTENVDLSFHNEETLELKWVGQNEIPPLFNPTHMEIIEDYFKKA